MLTRGNSANTINFLKYPDVLKREHSIVLKAWQEDRLQAWQEDRLQHSQQSPVRVMRSVCRQQTDSAAEHSIDQCQ